MLERKMFFLKLLFYIITFLRSPLPVRGNFSLPLHILERPARDPKTIVLGLLTGIPAPEEGAAVSLAVEKFIAEGHMPDYNFRVIWRDSGHPSCRDEVGVASVLDMYQYEGVDAIFGPFCGNVCFAIGYVLRYFNIPHFPSSCTNAELNDKDVFSTMVRTSAGMHKMGEAMKRYLEHHDWSRVFLWHRDSGSCLYGAEDMATKLPRYNVTLAERVRVQTGFTEPIPLNWIRETLRKIRERARVVLLCCHVNDIWRIMKEAADAGMTSEHYSWIYYNNNPSAESERPWLKIPDTYTPEQISYVKNALLSLKQIHFAQMNDVNRKLFEERMIERAARPPWNLSLDRSFPTTAFNLHDATYLYLMLVNRTVAEGGDISNGRQLALNARGYQFDGVSGHVRIDNNGDREPDYIITQLLPGGDIFTEYARLRMSNAPGKQYLESVSPYWKTETGKPAPDTPVCGFYGGLCPPESSDMNTIIIPVIVVSLCLILIAGGIIYIIREKRFERELYLMLWKIRHEEIEFTGGLPGSNIARSLKSFESESLMGSSFYSTTLGTSGHNNYIHNQVDTKVAHFRGQVVLVSFYPNGTIALTRKDLLELKWMKDMSHDNITVFLGACVDVSHIFAVHAFCSKGTLQDVLENDDIKLDWMFKSSLMSDLANGLCYIHDSPFGSHGLLKSSCCLIDSRWVLKITDYGLGALRQLRLSEPIQNNYMYCRELLWTAPELLRTRPLPVYGTQAGDIYSFGIILQELLYRALPFFYGTLTPQEIIAKLREAPAGQVEESYYRPELPSDAAQGSERSVISLMRLCWRETPGTRPTAGEARLMLRDICGGRKTDIVNAMLNKLEKYATNLEELVSKRTIELVEEKKKTDILLYRMLPRSVAEKLKKGEEVEPEVYSKVTIYFSDIVGFTTISSASTPIEVVNLLNDLYTTFDNIIDKHSVYKVETIGDAYMVVSGLPARTDRHAEHIADMALDIIAGVSHFRIRHIPQQKLKVRIGMHSGSCAAGIVGHVMPRYCLFGDTVNVASRMESTGDALRIHISEETKEALSNNPRYEIVTRGSVQLKGKGNFTTYWLSRNDGTQHELPLVE